MSFESTEKQGKLRVARTKERIRKVLSYFPDASKSRYINASEDYARRNIYRKRPSAKLASAIASVGGVQTGSSSSSYGRRGRPKGAYDSRYAQYVGVYGYRKYISQQRRLQLLQMQAQMQKQRQLQRQMPQNVNQNPQLEAYRQQIPPQQVQSYPPQNTYQQVQPKPQPEGVKLWDNTFMKLDQGVKSNPMDDAFNPQTPSGTPDGDYYTEPDFLSGKQVLRRRTGDKLFKW